MYVLSFAFWCVIVVLAVAHRFAGPRLQRVLLIDASILLYASLDRVLLIHLAWVVCITWVGARSRHYTDDLSMLRFVRVAASVLAFVPLLVHRLGEDVTSVAASLGERASLDTADWAISLVLPIGVAFYTLQAVDTIIPGQRRADDPPGFIDHALQICFFPLFIVGPVQRHDHLERQLRSHRVIGVADVRAAALLVLFGLIHKVVIADNLLPIADRTFATPATASGPDVVVAVAAFGMGIVADLLGLTLLAIGAARLFGVRLENQVDRPWMATSVLDFWSRFLSPVTDWFLRHVFLPAGGIGRGRFRTAGAVVVTFLAGSVWFGATATLVVWALLHAVAVLVQLWILQRRGPTRHPLTSRLVAFVWIMYAWLWFRADSLSTALDLHRALLRPELTSFARGSIAVTAMFGIALVAVDALGRRVMAPTADAGFLERAPLRGLVLAASFTALLVFSTGDLHTSVLGLR
ncbi:MAG: MBOAT family O-acyltransferase [Actinomycetota bacterium]